MKKTLARILSLALALSILGTTLFTAFAYESQSDELPVMINGEWVDTISARLVDGYEMLPLRAVAEYLGAQVLYKPETQKVYVMRGDICASFQLGSDEFDRTDLFGSQTISMYVPSYLDPETGVTYVPLDFFIQAYDLLVMESFLIPDDYSYGGELQNVIIIIDYTSLLNQYRNDFQIMNKLFSEKLDPQKTYSLLMTLRQISQYHYCDDYDDEFSYKENLISSINALFNAGQANIRMKSASKDSDGTVESEDKTMIYNFDTDTVYIKNSTLDTAGLVTPNGQKIDGSTWIRFENPEEADETEIHSTIFDTLNTLNSVSFFDLLAMYNEPYYLYPETYEEIVSDFDEMVSLYGDQAFEEVVKNDVTTYRSEQSWKDEDDWENSFSIRISEKDDQVIDFEILSYLHDDEEEENSLSIKISGEDIYNIHIEVEFVSSSLSDSLDILLTLEESSETPDAKPKDGEKVIDSDEFDDSDFVWKLMLK